MALNLKSLLTKIVENILPATGGQMTGDLKTSFKSSSLIGSKLATSNTVSALLTELNGKYQMGSVSINSEYTSGRVTIPAGWYNYIALNDKILLFGMTIDNKIFVVSSSSVSAIQSANIVTKGNMTNGTTTYYNLNGTSGTHYYYVREGNMVTVNFNIKCNKVSSSMTAFASGLPTHNYPTPITFPLSCESVGTYKPIYAQINSNGTISASLGVANNYYYGSISYITNAG